MVAAAATTTTASETVSATVPQVFSALNTIVHTMPGFYGTALAGMYLVNKPTSTAGHVVNFAAAAAITYGVNVLAPHFFLANAFSGATNTAANIPGTHDPFRHILDPIAKFESGGRANVLNGGGFFPADATIDQVRKYGKAAGSFQIMPNNPIPHEMGIPGSAKFIPNQFRMAKGLAIKRGAMKFAHGQMPAPDFISNLANEWCVAAAGPDNLASAACRAAGNPAQAAIPYNQMLRNVMQFKRHYSAPGTVFATMSPLLH